VGRLNIIILFKCLSRYIDVGSRTKSVKHDVGAGFRHDRAMPSPIPLVEPVMIADLPRREPSAWRMALVQRR
jgi:hypothetical protein